MSRNNLFAISFFIFILVILCVGVTARNDCNNVASKSPTLRLKRHLLCEYDPDVRPVKSNNNVTRVNFTITPHFVEYQHEKEIFELHAWVMMIWEDAHLTWDSTQFDDIKWITVSSYEIWKPDIVLHNEKIGENSPIYEQAKCWIFKNGLIEWLMPMKFSTFCVTDNTWWPYNIMNCTLQYSSWSHSGDEIDFTTTQHTLPGEKLKSGDAEWALLRIEVTKRQVKYKYNKDTSTARMLSYHFILKRHSSIARIAYVLPTIAFVALSLTTLWLEPKSAERMIVANLNFICHLLALQDVHWEMPKNGFNIPQLLSLYEKSLVIASFIIILTSFLRYLQKLSSDPPVWISNGTTLILHSKVGQILLINFLNPAATAKIETDADDNTDLMPSDGKKMPWLYVTILIGRLAFLSVLLTYIVLLSMYFPTYHRIN